MRGQALLNSEPLPFQDRFFELLLDDPRRPGYLEVVQVVIAGRCTYQAVKPSGLTEVARPPSLHAEEINCGSRRMWVCWCVGVVWER